jgi:GDP-L-fucose synthase
MPKRFWRKRMKIILLGGNGFVGNNFRKMATNHEILNFSRSTGYDLRDYQSSLKAFQDFEPDVVINLASHGGSLHYVTDFAADVIRDNILMALTLYNVVTGLKKKPTVINAISNCSYPGDTEIQKEEEWLSGPVHDSVFSFANGKRTLYYISKCYHKQYDVKSVNLIFSNAFGINDHIDPNKTHALDGLIIRIIKAKRSNEKEFEVWGTGKPIREWVYVEDFCKILSLACSFNAIIDPINVAQNKGYSIKESVNIIKELSGFNGEIVFNTEYQDGDPVKVLDNTRFKDHFNNYKFIDHHEALKRTIQYYEEVL